MRVSQRSSAYLFTITAAAALCLLLGGQILAQSGGGGAVGGPTFKVLRSMAGSSGTEVNGRLVLDDPRTVFYAGQDHR